MLSSRRALHLGLAIAALSAAACVSLLNVREVEYGESTDAGVLYDDAGRPIGADGAPLPSCDKCMPSGPDGWVGPFVVRERTSDASPGCPAGFAPNGELHDGLSIGDAGCGCACATSPTACNVAFVGNTGTMCFTAGTSSPAPLGTCVDLGARTTLWVDLDASAGRCTPVPEPPPALRWSYSASRCEPTPRTPCDNGATCAPAGERICIEHAGDVPCPGAPYVDRALRYGSVDTPPTCLPCACGQSAPAVCNFAVEYYTSTSNCNGAPFAISDPSTCGARVGGSASAKLAYLDSGVPLDCPPSGGGLVDASRPADLATVCCAP